MHMLFPSAELHYKVYWTLSATLTSLIVKEQGAVIVTIVEPPSRCCPRWPYEGVSGIAGERIGFVVSLEAWIHV